MLTYIKVSSFFAKLTHALYLLIQRVLYVVQIDYIYINCRGKVDDLSFFDYLSQFDFLVIEFHCNFSIFYKIIPYYVYLYFD